MEVELLDQRASRGDATRQALMRARQQAASVVPVSPQDDADDGEDSGDGGVTIVSASTSNNGNIGFADAENTAFSDLRRSIKSQC